MPDLVQSARVESQEGQHLLLTLPSEGAAREFETGTLLEIQSDESILLGVVLRRQDASIAVIVEHAINRAALAEIEEAWRIAQT